MSRSLSIAARLAAAISDGKSSIDRLIGRRGFAAASEAAMRLGVAEEKTGASIGKMPLIGDRMDSSPSSWVPDPITGYYRPANRGAEVDPAELRKLLLKNRNRG